MPKAKVIEEEELVPEPEITVIGNYPTLIRKHTGLFSLDVALESKGALGMPMRNIIELYGKQGVGKSTLGYYLSGVAAETDQITICDIEMADLNYIPSAVGRSGFKGQIKLVDVSDKDKKPLPHESMMMQMATDLMDDQVGAVMLDSVSSIQPIAESAGDFGEAFMGKRAKLVAQVARALSGALRTKARPSSAFVINHTYQIMGSGQGHTTAGGVVLPALAGVRANMWTKETFLSGEREDPTSQPIGFLVEGLIEKLRFGGKGRKFQFYIVPGLGVHVGATAMFDCFTFGFAKRDARVKIGDKNIGFLKADLLAYAAEGKSRKFTPFLEILDEQVRKIERGDVVSNN